MRTSLKDSEPREGEWREALRGWGRTNGRGRAEERAEERGEERQRGGGQSGRRFDPNLTFSLQKVQTAGRERECWNLRWEVKRHVTSRPFQLQVGARAARVNAPL